MEEPPKPPATLTLGPSGGQPAAGTTASLVTWRPGDVIGGLMEVQSLLGEGGFGSVYKVYHRGWDLEMAVKSPRADRVSSRAALESFVQEANTWVGLGLHPHIVTCYFVRLLAGAEAGTGTPPGLPRIFIEYMEGGSLADWLKEKKIREGKAALDVAIQVCRALEYAHSKGLVHRDLKPGNCLMTPGGTVKVTDFGLAKISEQEAQEPGRTGAAIAKLKGATVTGRLGTPEYMAPEQWNKPREAGKAADAWAFGAMLYELCLGRKTFPQDDDEPVDAFYARLLSGGWSYAKPAGLPPQLTEVIASCLSVDPSKRPSDLSYVEAALEAIYQRLFNARYPRTATPPTRPPADSLVNQGVSLADLGRADEALKLFAQALQEDPTHPAAIYDQGVLLLQAKKASARELIARLAESKRARATDWMPRYLLGLLHLRFEDAASASAELEDARVLARRNPMIAQARALAEARRYDLPLELFTAVPTGAEGAQLEESAFKVLLARAESAERAGELVKAYREAQRARGVKGHEHSAEALRLIRRLGTKGTRTVLSSGWQRLHFEGSGPALCVAAGPDGTRVASGHPDGTVNVWDAATGVLIRSFIGHKGAVNALCFTPDGRALSASADGSLKWWDLERVEPVRTFLGHCGPVLAVCCAPDGSPLYSGGEDHGLVEWDPATGKARLLKGHTGPVRCVCVTPDGKRLLSGGDDGMLRVWDAAGGHLKTLVGHGTPVVSVTASGDGRAISAGADGALRLWDLERGTSTALPASGCSRAKLLPGGFFALATGGKAARILNPGGTFNSAFEGHGDRLLDVCSSPDGGWAYGAGGDGVRQWELDWGFEFGGREAAAPAPEPGPSREWPAWFRPALGSLVGLMVMAIAASLVRLAPVRLPPPEDRSEPAPVRPPAGTRVEQLDTGAPSSAGLVPGRRGRRRTPSSLPQDLQGMNKLESEPSSLQYLRKDPGMVDPVETEEKSPRLAGVPPAGPTYSGPSARPESKPDPGCLLGYAEVPRNQFVIDVREPFRFKLEPVLDVFYYNGQCLPPSLSITLRDAIPPAGAREAAEQDRLNSMRGWRSDATSLLTVRLANGAAVHYYVGIQEDGSAGLVQGMLEFDGRVYFFVGHAATRGRSDERTVIGPWLDGVFGRLRRSGSPRGATPGRRLKAMRGWARPN